MEVKLHDVVVEIKDSLTWGDMNKINLAKGTLESENEITDDQKKQSQEARSPEFIKEMMKMVNENNLEAKYVAVECAITKITQGGKLIEFSRDWMDNLSNEDGNKLLDSVNKLSKKND